MDREKKMIEQPETTDTTTTIPTEPATTESSADSVAAKETRSAVVTPATSTTANTTASAETTTSPESVTAASETVANTTPIAQPMSRNTKFTIAAIAMVLFALAAVWFRLEQEGRVGTNFFSGIEAMQEAAAVVAIVNGDELKGRDLELSLEQLEQSALQQGLDPATPELADQIKTQATEMLVNTTLLLQTAAAEGIVVSEEEINVRITELEEQAGGAEVLAERMQEFDIKQETFEEDIRTELTIIALLDTVFATADLTVTEEEVLAVYEQVGGGLEGAPALELVRPQVEAQIRQAKEQQVVDAYLDTLREVADIEIIE